VSQQFVVIEGGKMRPWVEGEDYTENPLCAEPGRPYRCVLSSNDEAPPGERVNRRGLDPKE
jgi:hypothetical protein